jgi:hypothetical protein
MYVNFFITKKLVKLPKSEVDIKYSVITVFQWLSQCGFYTYGVVIHDSL